MVVFAHWSRSTPAALFVATAFMALIVLPTSAVAQQSSGWVEFGTHLQNQSDGPALAVVSPVASGYLQVTETLYLEATVPAVGLVVLSGDETHDLGDRHNIDTQIGNPFLGFGASHEFRGWEMKYSGGVGLPLGVPGGLSTYIFAEGMRGGWDPWLWSPRRLTPVIGVSGRHWLDETIRLGIHAKTGIMFWFGDGSAPREFAHQLAIEIATAPRENIEIGLRNRTVLSRFLASQGQRVAQNSVELFGQLEAREQFYQARLTVPLNEPHGFGFSSGGIWGLHLGAGMRF